MKQEVLFISLLVLLGNEFEDWIYQLPVEDEYTDPDYCHQN